MKESKEERGSLTGREKHVLEYGDIEGSEEEKMRYIATNNNEKGLKKDYDDLDKRFDIEYRATELEV